MSDAVLELSAKTASAVAEVLGSFGVTVELGRPALVARESNPLAGLPVPAVISSVSYVGGVSGGNVLGLTAAGARRLAVAMGLPEEAEEGELSDLALSAVSEAANQMLAAAASATAAVLGREIDISPPSTQQVAEEAGAPIESDQAAFVTSVTLTIEGEDGRLVQMVPQAFVLRMEAALDGLQAEGEADDPGAADGDALASSWLLETPLTLDVELGRAFLSADEIVALRDGAIVGLDRLASDPIDLLVNGVPFASGRLLLDDGQWAVRIDALLDSEQLGTTNG